MINVKELKLKRIFSLKAYLEEKAKRDRVYNEYVENAIRKGEEEFAQGRVVTLDEFKKYMEQELSVNTELNYFEPISESHKEERKKMIEDLQDQIRGLNITEEIREKDDLELTQEEQEKLYEEYVYTSLIDASKSAIKYGVCDIKYWLQDMEEKYGVKIPWMFK